MDHYQELLNEIKELRKEIQGLMIVQENFVSFRDNQDKKNNDIQQEIKLISNRLNIAEKEISLLEQAFKTQNQLTIETKDILNKLLQQQTDNAKLNSKQTEQIKNANDNISTHKKIFFAMLSLNFSLIVAGIGIFLKKFL